MNLTKLGARIRAERNKNGLTQEQLAEKCDISTNYMSLIENGRSMSLVTLIKFANVFGVTVDYLLTDIVTPHSDNLIDETVLTLKSLNTAEKRYFLNMVKQYTQMKNTKD